MPLPHLYSCLLPFFPPSSLTSIQSLSYGLGTGWVATHPSLPEGINLCLLSWQNCKNIPLLSKLGLLRCCHPQSWQSISDKNRFSSLLQLRTQLPHLSIFHFVGSPRPQSWAIDIPSSSDHEGLYFNFSEIMCGKPLLSLIFQQKIGHKSLVKVLLE